MNRIYIFERVEGITSEWHDGGGLAIVTKSGDPVKVFREANPELEPDFNNCEDPVSYIVPENIGERIFLFPDNGCC